MQGDEEDDDGREDMRKKTESESEAKSAAIKRAKNLMLPKDLPSKYDHAQWRAKHGKDAGTAELQPYHRNKLRALLTSLLQEHLYSAASGPVSVLLQAHTREDVYQHRDLQYFWAAMEVLRQADAGKSHIKRIKRLYRILQRKQLNQISRGNVQLELAIYLMSLGDLDSYEASYNELRPIVDVPPFRDDPVVNLCHGYTLHRLWHDRVVQDVEKQFEQDLGARPQNGVDRDDYEEGGGDNDYMDVEEHFSVSGSMAGRQLSDANRDSADISHEGLPFSSQGDLGLYEDDEEQKVAVDDFWKKAVVRWSPDLDRRLFPVRLPQTRTRHLYKVPMDNTRTRDAHTSAIKYLKNALSLDSDMTPALLPLVQCLPQLLVAAGDVRGALEEIEKSCSTPHLVPLSIKALLLESVDPKSSSKLAKCYESILHVNPSSSLSLDRLIQLHASGKYRTQALVESISFHLDVDRGLIEVWQQLASCFLHLKQRHEEEVMETGMETFETVEDIETEDDDTPYLAWKKKVWDDRSSWWRYKHFHEKSFKSEQQVDGDWKRIAYKAACYVHILDEGNAYEVEVSQAFTSFRADSLLSLVNDHRQNFHGRLAENYYNMESDSSHM